MDLNNREKLLIVAFIALIIIAKSSSSNQENFMAAFKTKNSNSMVDDIIKSVRDIFSTT